MYNDVFKYTLFYLCNYMQLSVKLPTITTLQHMFLLNIFSFEWSNVIVIMWFCAKKFCR